MSGRAALAGALLAALWLAEAAAAEPLVHRPHCQEGLFCIAAEREGDRISLWLEVETAEALVLVVQPTVEGLEGSDSAARVVSTRPERRKLAGFRVIQPGDWRLDWRYSFHPAGPPARHVPEAPYRLPYGPGSAFRVIQGAEGAFTHQGPLAHAIDWAMPVGSEIRAARDGQVIGLRDDQPEGGPDPGMLGRENYLWIRHGDGTVSHYLHVLADSVAVALGDRVAAGQVIARSGNSGYSSEPHLHFHVASPTESGGAAFETFPLYFDLGDGRAEKLQTGRSYRAPAETKAASN